MQRSKHENLSRRVVVTGLGVISSIGIGWQTFWKNLLAGTSGISKVEAFDVSSYNRQYAGEVKGFEAEKYFSKRRIKFLGKASQFAYTASLMALKDAGVDAASLNTTRVGVCLGTTMGEPQIMEHLDEKCFPNNDYVVDRLSAFKYPASNISQNISTYLKLKGPNMLFSNACAAGNYSIGKGFDLIQSGKVDAMLVGGADSFSRISFTGFARLLAIAPEKCQPFDKNRSGLIPAEGAGMLFLETLESAQKRGATIYAEVLGYGLSCDAHHMTQPSVEGIGRAIKKSMSEAGVGPEDVDYICAHGTGTPENDKAECAAIHQAFGARAKDIPVSSIKSMLGHTMGAASALEAIACCLALKDQAVPPTINYHEPDPECDIDCVPNVCREADLDVVLNNASAFGGNNCCVVLRRG